MSWNNYYISNLPFLKNNNKTLPEWAKKTKLCFQSSITIESDLEFLENWEKNKGVLLIPNNKTRPDGISFQFSDSKETLESLHFVTLGIKWYSKTISSTIKEDNKQLTDPQQFFSQKLTTQI